MTYEWTVVKNCRQKYIRNDGELRLQYLDDSFFWSFLLVELLDSFFFLLRLLNIKFLFTSTLTSSSTFSHASIYIFSHPTLYTLAFLGDNHYPLHHLVKNVLGYNSVRWSGLPLRENVLNSPNLLPTTRLPDNSTDFSYNYFFTLDL